MRRRERRQLVLGAGGLVAVAVSVVGPLAERAHEDFAAHVITHVLLGMLAPLLLSLAGPVGWALRALPTAWARRLVGALRSRPLRWLTEPWVAAVLDVGGLWLIYTFGVYPAMHHRPGLHAVVHLHMFAAGYLFTTAIVGSDPLAHRRSHRHRAVVLVAAVAGHDILAKYLYAHPPAGVPTATAEQAAMMMYYAGDAVSVTVMVVLCLSWLRASRRRGARPVRPPAPVGPASVWPA